MALSLQVTPSAFADIQNAIDYYQDKQEYLAERFAEILDKTFAALMSMPLSASIIYEDVRYKRIQKFPFIVIYRVDVVSDVVQVLRIFNTYLDPSKI